MPNHASLCQNMCFLLAFPLQLPNLRYSIEFRLRSWKGKTNFAFTIKIRHKSVSHGNCKITRKEISILFSGGYLTTLYSVVECCINTKPSTRRNYWFWLLWGLFKEYVKKYYYDSVKESKFPFRWYFQVGKKSIM